MFSKIGMADESGLRTRRSLDFGTPFLSTLFATTIIVAYSVILRIASQSLVGGYLYIFYLKKDIAPDGVCTSDQTESGLRNFVPPYLVRHDYNRGLSCFLTHCFAIACWRIYEGFIKKRYIRLSCRIKKASYCEAMR